MILVEVTLLDGCSGRLVPEEVADHASEALTMKFVDQFGCCLHGEAPSSSLLFRGAKRKSRESGAFCPDLFYELEHGLARLALDDGLLVENRKRSSARASCFSMLMRMVMVFALRS